MTSRVALGEVLFAGTREDAARAQADASPAHTWKEAQNPANQWLANLKGQRRHDLAVLQAGWSERQRVRRMYREAGYPIPGDLP